MNHEAPSQMGSLSPDLAAIAQQIQAAAQARQANCLELLMLLRLLERLHHDIRDTLFQNALPDNRQALYALLRDIEIHGGWPYINRMRLQALMEKLSLEGAFDSPESAVEAQGIQQRRTDPS